tara:strand:+ start:970 stop:1818 length:849 start_codon:yes stop_codon:yes gene_type:complete
MAGFDETYINDLAEKYNVDKARAKSLTEIVGRKRLTAKTEDELKLIEKNYKKLGLAFLPRPQEKEFWDDIKIEREKLEMARKENEQEQERSGFALQNAWRKHKFRDNLKKRILKRRNAAAERSGVESLMSAPQSESRIPWGITKNPFDRPSPPALPTKGIKKGAERKLKRESWKKYDKPSWGFNRFLQGREFSKKALEERVKLERQAALTSPSHVDLLGLGDTPEWGFAFGKIMRPYRKFVIRFSKKNGIIMKTLFGEKRLKDDKIGIYLKANKRKFYLHRW